MPISERHSWKTTARAKGRLAVAAFTFVVEQGHAPLATLLQLRATSRHLEALITGHMPAGLQYRLHAKAGRIQASRETVAGHRDAAL